MLVEQPEIHRRIRAAMLLADIASWDDLAAATGYSRTTVKDLGTPRRTAERKHLLAVAAACRVPFEWFTVSDLAEAVRAYAAGEITLPAGDAPPAPPGVAPRSRGGSGRSAPSPQDERPDQEPGASEGGGG